MSELHEHAEYLRGLQGTSLDNVEKVEHFPYKYELERASQRVREQVDAGDGFERATEALAAELHEELLGRIEVGKEIARGVAELVELARPILGEATDTIHEGINASVAMLEKGEAWLRENPEKVEAGVRLLVLAVVAAFEPELASRLLRENPDRLFESMRTLLEGGVG